jgi:hypothetical protein
MSMTLFWIIGSGGALACLGTLILIWKRRQLIPKSARNLGVNVVERLTEKFPNIRRAELAPGTKGAPAREGVQGNLAQTKLHDLLQFLALGSKSGILEISCGRRSGRLMLCEGRVVKVSYRGQEGLEAIFMLMDVVEGDFEFTEQFVEETASSERWEVVDIIMLWMNRKPKKKSSAG